MATPESTLWTRILSSCSTPRTTPTVSVVAVGGVGSGKSSVLSGIGHNSGQPMEPEEASGRRGLLVGYCDVFDDADEEKAAVVKTAEAFGADAKPLLRFANPKVFVVVLDWSKPWRFASDLETYLGMLHEISIDASAEKRDIVEAMFREFKDHDPNEPKVSMSMRNNLAAHAVTLPLGPGVLTHNLGIPIIVVCCKVYISLIEPILDRFADAMTTLEREHGYTDETFDYIQQTLRTICLKYGASLFYTSTFKPPTLLKLRTYILHQLLRNTDAAPAFPFAYPANVIDRDAVCVPAGWDNWGLVRAQGAGFRCEEMAGWVDGVGGEGLEAAKEELRRARELYEVEIKNPVADKARAKQPLITSDPEHLFLQHTLDLLTSLSTTTNPTTSGTHSPFPGNHPDSFAQRLMAQNAKPNSSADMLEDVSQKLAKLAKLKEQGSPAAVRNPPKPAMSMMEPSPFTTSTSFTASSPSKTASSTLSGPHTSASPLGGGAGTTGGSDNAVLSSFFQSLLNKKKDAKPSPVVGKSSVLVGVDVQSSPKQTAGVLAGEEDERE
ncbi:hypothetical protein HDU98_010426 [Podochytrium sp. JEL0797]|nr:hypothetical protein HDU98_010426 [Podochytrium sp. JEL0797]